jgi:hypothetical protein
VILCGTTSWGLQRDLEIFEEELRRSGLSLDPGKSKCVSLVASGREKKVKLVMTPTFRASGSWLNQVDGTTLWKYLGLKFRGCGMAGCGSDDVAECLERLTRAPLKPQQRMHLLRVFLLPRFFHVWRFGRLNAGILRHLDIRVRNAIRTWLPLPHDVPVGYFHVPTNAGGFGIPQLSRFIPLLRLKRFERLAHSSVESVRECARTDTAVAKVRWCRERLADVVDQVADGTRGWSVKRKVSYQTVVGVRRPDIVASRGAKSPSWTCKLSHLTLLWTAHTAKRSPSIVTRLSSPRAWCEELRYNQGGERKKKRRCDLPALPSRGEVSGLPSPRSPCASWG